MKNRVRECRQGLGLTQEQLAEQAGVSRQTIISIEGGRYDPSLPLALRLARLLGQRIEDLFIDEEE
ncbi:MAG: helix-turn-helix transcriptional regulator [Spirochaetaceae bacterium]|nr:helix-turn-helix transcriptional regulator [Spirochaetaceae bacterium]HPE89050.1 helix-turn-helix transcriptional regulator [Spirochaetales bacterium]